MDAIRAALQAAVDEVDTQMSMWNAESALMRINAAPVGDWVVVPEQLRAVLRLDRKFLCQDSSRSVEQTVAQAPQWPVWPKS